MSVRNPENCETPQHEKTFEFTWQSQPLEITLLKHPSTNSILEEHNSETVIDKIKSMFKTAKLLDMDNPIGEDLK